MTSHTENREAPDAFAPVFTDQIMRQLTEEDPARELLRLWSYLPILLCAGVSRSLTEETATARGIRALLMKPIGHRDLCHAVQRLLAQRAARSVRPGARQFPAV